MSRDGEQSIWDCNKQLQGTMPTKNEFLLRIPSDLNWYYPIVAKVLYILQNVVILRSVFQEGHGLIKLLYILPKWEPANLRRTRFSHVTMQYWRDQLSR